MLAATVRIVQVLDTFEVRAVITVFSPGSDPEQFSAKTRTFVLPDEMLSADALSITTALLRLWSEMTISD